MNLVQNDIDTGSAKEAEEINAPVAKLVKASPFQSDIVSSSLIGSTKDFEGLGKEIMNCNWFNIKKIDATVAGRDYSRLSVLT